MTIAVLIAAAGRSSRMGRSKALLPLRGSTFVEHIARCLLGAGITRVFVSLPECALDSRRIKERLREFPIGFCQNLYPERELLGSVQSVLLGADFRALMILPVDIPFVTKELNKKFCSVRSLESSAIFCATYQGEPVHPVMFTYHFFPEILGLGHHDSLRTIMQRYQSEIVNIETDDARLLLNINTPEDYQRLSEMP